MSPNSLTMPPPAREPPLDAAFESLAETLAGRRVALVHDWLTGMRGGEKVLEAVAEPFPGAPI